MKNRIIIACAIAVMYLLSSCSKMNDLHQQYLDKGEKVYAAKVDSVKAFIGVDSQILDIYLPSQRVAKGVVKWNLGADSLEFAAPENGNLKTVTVTGLSEGNYTYEIYTYDVFGNVSIPFEVTSNVISQATLDNMVEVACKSYYYQMFDKLVGPIPDVEDPIPAKIGSAQNFNGAAWFMWKTGPLPGATVIFEYQNKSGEWVTRSFKGESIKNDAWNSELTDALVEPANTVEFYFWTSYGGLHVDEDIKTTIDFGEEYAESIRYYEYSDHIYFHVDPTLTERVKDNW